MIYDSVDDDCEDDFELERFLVVQLARRADGRIGCSLQYTEFDRRIYSHLLQKKEIEKEMDVLLKIADYQFTDAPYFLRSYVVDYDQQMEQVLHRSIKINYASNTTRIFVPGETFQGLESVVYNSEHLLFSKEFHYSDGLYPSSYKGHQRSNKSAQTGEQTFIETETSTHRKVEMTCKDGNTTKVIEHKW